MDPRLFIYIGNHGKKAGIEEYLALFKHVFRSRGIHVEVSSTLRANSTNIIIDEFTNYIENRRIAEFRRDKPNNRCIFILTEFAERKFGVESLNHFGGIFDTAFIALLNVYLRLSRNDFPPVRLKDYLALVLLSPILAVFVLTALPRYIASRLLSKTVQNRMGSFQERLHRLTYFHMRYLGLKAHLKYADAIISSHESIMRGYHDDRGVNGEKLNFLGVIYPEFNKQNVLETLMVGKMPYIEMTGSITSYRRKWIRRLSVSVRQLGLNNIFGISEASSFLSFSSSENVKRAAFSLHPPQTRNWKYCSPTRIYRALQTDHNLPVLTKYFSQNPIEDVCLLLKNKYSIIEMIDMYFNRKTAVDFVGTRIEIYNEIVNQRNDVLFNLVKQMESIKC